MAANYFYFLPKFTLQQNNAFPPRTPLFASFRLRLRTTLFASFRLRLRTPLFASFLIAAFAFVHRSDLAICCLIQYQVFEHETGHPISFADSFCYWHTKREKGKGKVKASSAQSSTFVDAKSKKVYALVEAAEERQNENSSVNGSNGSRSFEDFENDPIAEVFGKEKRKNYCRAISSTSTMKQVKLTQASKAIANFKEDEDRKWKKKIENNQNRLTEEFRSMHSTMMKGFNILLRANKSMYKQA